MISNIGINDVAKQLATKVEENYKKHKLYPDFLEWLDRGMDEDYGERDDSEISFKVFLEI